MTDGTVHHELRAELVALGWTPPGSGVVQALLDWSSAYPRMDIDARPGTLVMFDARGGYPYQQDNARKELRLRGVYEVEQIDVGSSSSTVKLCGHEGRFNTVMFAQAPELDVYRGAGGNLHAAGSPNADPIIERELARMRLLHWRGKDDIGHTCTVEWATEQLKRLFDEWPGGLEEVESAMRTSAGRAACIAALETELDQRPAWVTAEQALEHYATTDGPLLELDALLSKLVQRVQTQVEVGTMADDELGVDEVKAIQKLVRRMVIAVPAVPAFDAAAAREAFENTFHKVRAEVSFSWWSAIWRTALEWAASQAGEPASADGWTAWNGEQCLFDGLWPRCPVTPSTRVRVRFRDGEELTTSQPALMRWAWTRPYRAAADIVAFKIIND